MTVEEAGSPPDSNLLSQLTLKATLYTLNTLMFMALSLGVVTVIRCAKWVKIRCHAFRVTH